MSERDDSSDVVGRRTLLAALATGLGGGSGVARGSLAERTQPTQYVVEQGDRCIPVTPLVGSDTVATFYDYRTPETSPPGAAYSSYGTTVYQRSDTSILFLYQGPNGLYLVVVHDALHDGTAGGAVTFDLAFENPGRGSWVVADDDYGGPNNFDTFARTADGWRVDWTWGTGRSDGGVYGPLGEAFAVTIDPAFNEAATLYGDHFTGSITDWQVLTGDGSDPRHVSLALDRPLTIRTGSCGDSPPRERAEDGQSVGQSAGDGGQSAENDGQSAGNDDRSPGTDGGSSGLVVADVELVRERADPRSGGRLPVVVRSTAEFDATEITLGSVAFGPGDASPFTRVRTDADGDGRTDLKLLFRTDETGIDRTTDRVRLTAETTDGRRVVGSVEVPLVPSAGGDDEGDGDGAGDED